MALTDYQKKRNFKGTPEPRGTKAKKKKEASKLRFVIQLHDATRKHYDVRLELDGTMKSWAVPKGPSLNPMERRLAVEVEDHPMEYNDFEGVIPRGHYGAGVVMIWDEGTYTARSVEYPAKDEEDALRRGFAKGHLTVVLEGTKLQGEFALIRLAKGSGNSWLLVKKHDRYATREDITHADRSARSGRTLGEIAANAPKDGHVWDSRPRKKEVKNIRQKNLPTAPRKRLASRFKKTALRDPNPHSMKAVSWLPSAFMPTSPGLINHPLFDGYRALAVIQANGDVALSSKSGVPVTKRFPELEQALRDLQGSLVLDGIIVPLDEEGRPRRRGYGAAQARLRYAFFIYDLLHADGFDLTPLPLCERLAALQQINLQHDALRLVSPTGEESPSSEPGATLGLLLRAQNEPYHGSNPRTCRQAASRNRGVDASTRPVEAHSLSGSRHQIVTRSVQPKALQALSLTNLSKVYWPKDGITKGELIDYYRHVANVMLPYLRDRPQSLNRHPNGIDAASFFQKEVSGQVPGWMQTATISSGRSGKTVTYALCQTEADLLYLVNLGCIEINTWLSRVETINQPDFIVFDLDPADIAFDAVVETAKTVKRVLDEIDAPAFCKTSGSRGLHVYVPVLNAENYDKARQFAEQLSREVHRRLPDTTSLERIPERRTQRIYLDYLQNRIGQTMASVYSVRPRPHATVSTPLKWSEVKRGLDPSVFTIASVPRRLARLGDLWAGISAAAAPLERYQRALDDLLSKRKDRKER